VDHALLVCGLESRRHLPRDPQRLVARQRSFLQSIFERLALDQFHGEELQAAVVFEAVDRGDVSMLQTGEQSCFALEACNPLGIARHLFGQDLDCDLAAQLCVTGAIDLTHAALAQLRGDLVVTEGLADQFGSPGCAESEGSAAWRIC
jgi:hypothetical protein